MNYTSDSFNTLNLKTIEKLLNPPNSSPLELHDSAIINRQEAIVSHFLKEVISYQQLNQEAVMQTIQQLEAMEKLINSDLRSQIYARDNELIQILVECEDAKERYEVLVQAIKRITTRIDVLQHTYLLPLHQLNKSYNFLQSCRRITTLIRALEDFLSAMIQFEQSKSMSRHASFLVTTSTNLTHTSSVFREVSTTMTKIISLIAPDSVNETFEEKAQKIAQEFSIFKDYIKNLLQYKEAISYAADDLLQDGISAFDCTKMILAIESLAAVDSSAPGVAVDAAIRRLAHMTQLNVDLSKNSYQYTNGSNQGVFKENDRNLHSTANLLSSYFHEIVQNSKRLFVLSLASIENMEFREHTMLMSADETMRPDSGDNETQSLAINQDGVEFQLKMLNTFWRFTLGNLSNEIKQLSASSATFHYSFLANFISIYGAANRALHALRILTIKHDFQIKKFLVRPLATLPRVFEVPQLRSCEGAEQLDAILLPSVQLVIQEYRKEFICAVQRLVSDTRIVYTKLSENSKWKSSSQYSTGLFGANPVQNLKKVVDAPDLLKKVFKETCKLMEQSTAKIEERSQQLSIANVDLMSPDKDKTRMLMELARDKQSQLLQLISMYKDLIRGLKRQLSKSPKIETTYPLFPTIATEFGFGFCIVTECERILSIIENLQHLSDSTFVTWCDKLTSIFIHSLTLRTCSPRRNNFSEVSNIKPREVLSELLHMISLSPDAHRQALVEYLIQVLMAVACLACTRNDELDPDYFNVYSLNPITDFKKFFTTTSASKVAQYRIFRSFMHISNLDCHFKIAGSDTTKLNLDDLRLLPKQISSLYSYCRLPPKDTESPLPFFLEALGLNTTTSWDTHIKNFKDLKANYQNPQIIKLVADFCTTHSKKANLINMQSVSMI